MSSSNSDRPDEACAAAGAAIEAKSLSSADRLAQRRGVARDGRGQSLRRRGRRGRNPPRRLPRRPARPISQRPLDPHAFLPDEFVVAGADVYLKLPERRGEKQPDQRGLDRAFGTVATMRNWRTVLRLLERLDA